MIVSTPGRICFFGEHQDYLGLPVIAAAISRRIEVHGKKNKNDQVVIKLPDINQKEVFSVNAAYPYEKPRDYFRSTLTILKRLGLSYSQGVEATVHGRIPINSGTSSSSALIVSWAKLLDQLSDTPRHFSNKELAEIAYSAEVLEFGEPGGMMDHYATALGNVIYLESKPQIRVETLKPVLGTFVLGDSLEPKETISILKRCRTGMEQVIKKVKEYDPYFNLATKEIEEVKEYRKLLTADELDLLVANLDDRNLLLQGKTLLTKEISPSETESFDLEFGSLLDRHHANLRDHKKTSTPKIDRMLDEAKNAGALGGKINGSGGGGCMFAYAPGNAQEVASAIEKAGGKSYIITVDEGSRLEQEVLQLQS